MGSTKHGLFETGPLQVSFGPVISDFSLVARVTEYGFVISHTFPYDVPAFAIDHGLISSPLSPHLFELVVSLFGHGPFKPLAS